MQPPETPKLLTKYWNEFYEPGRSVDKLHLVVRGGLGNQLFQIAAARCISEMSGKKLFLDVSSYSSRTQDSLGRKFEAAPFIEEGEPVHFFRVPSKLLASLHQKIYWTLRFFGDLTPSLFVRLGVLSGARTDFSNLKLDALRSARFIDSYFVGIGGNLSFDREIRRIVDQLRALRPLVVSRNYVAIHLRLGDYLSINENLVPNSSRLEKAVRAFQEVGLNSFRLFSDEPQRALKMLQDLGVGADIELAEPLPSAALTLGYLSSHTGIICSSSTFSWWAAKAISLEGGRVFFPDPQIEAVPNLRVELDWELY